MMFYDVLRAFLVSFLSELSSGVSPLIFDTLTDEESSLSDDDRGQLRRKPEVRLSKVTSPTPAKSPSPVTSKRSASPALTSGSSAKKIVCFQVGDCSDDDDESYDYHDK